MKRNKKIIRKPCYLWNNIVLYISKSKIDIGGALNEKSANNYKHIYNNIYGNVNSI